MKSILFLILLVFIAWDKDIIDIGKCIYKAPKVQELINDVIISIATQDYSKLLPKIKEALPDLIRIVLGCLTDANATEDGPKLTFGFDSRPIPIVMPDCRRDCLHSDSMLCRYYCFGKIQILKK